MPGTWPMTVGRVAVLAAAVWSMIRVLAVHSCGHHWMCIAGRAYDSVRFDGGIALQRIADKLSQHGESAGSLVVRDAIAANRQKVL